MPTFPKIEPVNPPEETEDPRKQPSQDENSTPIPDQVWAGTFRRAAFLAASAGAAHAAQASNETVGWPFESVGLLPRLLLIVSHSFLLVGEWMCRTVLITPACQCRWSARVCFCRPTTQESIQRSLRVRHRGGKSKKR